MAVIFRDTFSRGPGLLSAFRTPDLGGNWTVTGGNPSISLGVLAAEGDAAYVTHQVSPRIAEWDYSTTTSSVNDNRVSLLGNIGGAGAALFVITYGNTAPVIYYRSATGNFALIGQGAANLPTTGHASLALNDITREVLFTVGGARRASGFLSVAQYDSIAGIRTSGFQSNGGSWAIDNISWATPSVVHKAAAAFAFEVDSTARAAVVTPEPPASVVHTAAAAFAFEVTSSAAARVVAQEPGTNVVHKAAAAFAFEIDVNAFTTAGDTPEPVVEPTVTSASISGTTLTITGTGLGSVEAIGLFLPGDPPESPALGTDLFVSKTQTQIVATFNGVPPSGPYEARIQWPGGVVVAGPVSFPVPQAPIPSGISMDGTVITVTGTGMDRVEVAFYVNGNPVLLPIIPGSQTPNEVRLDGSGLTPGQTYDVRLGYGTSNVSAGLVTVPGDEPEPVGVVHTAAAAFLFEVDTTARATEVDPGPVVHAAAAAFSFEIATSAAASGGQSSHRAAATFSFQISSRGFADVDPAVVPPPPGREPFYIRRISKFYDIEVSL